MDRHFHPLRADGFILIPLTIFVSITLSESYFGGVTVWKKLLLSAAGLVIMRSWVRRQLGLTEEPDAMPPLIPYPPLLNFFSPAPPPPTFPTPTDVLHTQHLLSQLLPPELTLQVLDMAGYWIKQTSKREELQGYSDLGRKWPYEGGTTDSMRVLEGSTYLESKPLLSRVVRSIADPRAASQPTGTSRDIWIVKAITIELLSRDQGWSDDTAHHNTYSHSHTWFEICRKSRLPTSSSSPNRVAYAFDPSEPSLEIQRNLHAHHNFVKHEIRLDLEGDVLRGLKKGDKLVLLAKAQYPGWMNHVKSAKITVEYGL